jgi:hypothetical protein
MGAKFVVFPELALTTFFPRWWMENEAEVDERYFEKSMPSKAKAALLKRIPSLKDFQMHDLRFEAVNRLLEKGHQPHTVADATGVDINKVLEIFKGIQRGE